MYVDPAGLSISFVWNAQVMPAGLTASQQAHVLGAEICMWGESMGSGNLAE